MSEACLSICVPLGSPPPPPPPIHGLTNYIDTKAKCRYLKKLTWKGTLRQVLFRVYRLVTGDTVSHVGIFDPAS